MKYREWITTKVNVKDIIVDCIDPTGNDADHPIYPLGCSRGFNSFKETNTTDIFTNHSEVNTELLFYSYGLNSGIIRRGFKKSNIYNLDQKNIGHRQYYKMILDKHYKMTPLSIEGYFSNLGKYKFVISPEGSGIDCYRHYETWISKGIPIIEYNSFIEKKYSKLPILWTRDYAEINDSYLNSQYPKFLDREYDFRKLLFRKYKPHFQREIAIVSEHNNYIANPLQRKQIWKFSDYFKDS